MERRKDEERRGRSRHDTAMETVLLVHVVRGLGLRRWRHVRERHSSCRAEVLSE